MIRIIKILSLLALLFLIAACSETYCISNDPSTSAAPNAVIVNSQIITVNGDSTSAAQWTTGPYIATGSNILLKVSGTLETCPTCSGNNCVNPCPIVISGSPPVSTPPNPCPSTAPNCQDPMCPYGTYYSVAGKNYNWTSTVTLNAGETAQITIPPANMTGPNSTGCPSDDDQQCTCAILGCSPPAQNCIMSNTCSPYYGNCTDLTYGNVWAYYCGNNPNQLTMNTVNVLGADFAQGYANNTKGSTFWSAGGIGLTLKLCDGVCGDNTPSTFLVLPAGATNDGRGSLGGVEFTPSVNDTICTPENIAINPNCLQTDPYRITTQTVTNTSSSPVTLNFRLHDGETTSDPTYYHDNLGGYNVYVLSQGCTAVNGLPVAGQNFGNLIFTSDNSTPASSGTSLANYQITSCSGVDQNLASSCSIEANTATYYIQNPTAGTMYLMINPNPNGTKTTGSLAITSYTTSYAGQFSAFVSSVIGTINTTLTAKTASIFSNITGNIDYIMYIRVLLQFYIILYAIMFLMGTTQISQFDLLIRLVKIAAIVGLTSPNSWSFFSNNLFNLYISGGATLINLFTASSLATAQVAAGASSIGNPFAFVDSTFNVIFFDSRTWLRIFAIVFTTPLGFVFCFLMLWGMLLYFLAIIEAVIEYILSILAVQILLVLAPIFIPFILFKATHHLFEHWLQFLFSFSIKPVILLIGLNILSNMLYVIVLQLFSFPVCFGCAFQVYLGPLTSLTDTINKYVDIGNFFFCIPWIKPWGFSQAGDGMNMLSATGIEITGIMLFVLITQFMAKLPKFVDDMSARLSGTRAAILKAEGGVGGEHDQNTAQRMMSSANNKALGVVGMDRESKQRRQGAAASKGAPEKDKNQGVNVKQGGGGGK